ncbi:hypothetical protein RRG08_022320 [Elysia crispata]|uniref:Uncharacterized protein n=1 Tax=Elysia crispata TaxID=231223 RepID=A0AAE1DK56_9GAST|nr:hypothetical protein RRG08_022320 [Elysia crispata]
MQVVVTGLSSGEVKEAAVAVAAAPVVGLDLIVTDGRGCACSDRERKWLGRHLRKEVARSPQDNINVFSLEKKTLTAPLKFCASCEKVLMDFPAFQEDLGRTLR